MHCPKCHAPMKAIRYGAVQVDRCTGCQGIWFDLAELEQLRKLEGSQMVDSGDPAVGRTYNSVHNIDCPRCTVAMLAMREARQNHIQYEKCPSCHGVFFDAGEFRDIKEETVLDYLKFLLA